MVVNVEAVTKPYVPLHTLLFIRIVPFQALVDLYHPFFLFFANIFNCRRTSQPQDTMASGALSSLPHHPSCTCGDCITAAINTAPLASPSTELSIMISCQTPEAPATYTMNQKVDSGISDVDCEDEGTENLKELVERLHGTRRAGDRDTIDSILSVYDNVPHSNEINQVSWEGTSTEENASRIVENVRNALQRLEQLQHEMDDVISGHRHPPPPHHISRYVASQISTNSNTSASGTYVEGNLANDSGTSYLEDVQGIDEEDQDADSTQEVFVKFATAMDEDIVAEIVLTAALFSLFGLVLAVGFSEGM